ncbi:Hypothetical predicted protein [Paramuricea clavata]|uniref:Endonuclease/exonuclease/phosphatase domain-containing protein n=1 Tax=Paramuricea clavata TaxID=317549 RepID=A0A6S7GNI8_PARCT|nr:Hypothetical predicted protein [Paramuricea clavata]
MAHSLNNKSAQFTDFICEHTPDLVVVTETWITDKESAVKTLSTPSTYKFFDEPRLNRRGSGIGLLFKENILVTKIAGEFSEYLVSVVLNTDPVLIVGDFNIHVDCHDNTDAVKLLELFESVGLGQHVHTPTHCSGHTLDLIVTRQTDQIIASSPRADCLFSDHIAVFCQLQLDRVPRINSKVSYRNLAAINLDALRKDLSNSILCENMESFDLNELV